MPTLILSLVPLIFENASYGRVKTTVGGVLCDNITENDKSNEYNNTVNG